MPALIEDIVQDADIHVLQVHCKVLCNCIGFRKKCLMHRARSIRIIMPYDRLTVQCVCDFDPFQTRVGENTGAFAVGTGLTDQNFDRNIGPRCAKSYLVTVTADAVTEQVKLGFQDGFQIGNGIDHGFHRLVGQQDGLRCNVIKGQHFL